MKRILPYIIAFTAACGVSAQDVTAPSELQRPIVQQYRIGFGSSRSLSTYLSPLSYSGNAFSVSGEWSKASQWCPENLVMDFNATFNLRKMRNPRHTAVMDGLDLYFSWGMAWRKRLPYNLQVTAGGALRVNGGALYLTRNGNNPVTALASAGLDITASASWHTKIKRLPLIVSNQISVPSLSAFFSPQYGETYYEIWLGNHNGLAHCGWWGNNFGIRHLLSVKLDFGRTAMELGYLYDRQSYWAGGLNTVINTHQLVIGVIPYGLGIKRKRTINSPLY